MWECQNCHEQVDDLLAVCGNCGTARAGDGDPTSRPATQQQAGSPPGPTDDSTGATADSYEFKPDEKKIISEVSFNMNFVGVVELIGGGLALVVGMAFLSQGGGFAAVQGGLAIIVGTFTLQAAGAFHQIGETAADHMEHLMTALSAVRNLYRVHVIILMILLAALCIAFPRIVFR